MKLAVIIVSYNTKPYLRKCLETLSKSNFPVKDLSIFVVDNASTDDTLEELKVIFQDVTWIVQEKNMGFSFANNVGIASAGEADYYLFLNPDTEVLPDGLSKMVSYLECNTDVGILTPYLQLPDGSIDDACHRGFPTPWNAFCHFFGLAAILPHSLLFNGYHLGYRSLDRIHEIDACAGAAMLVRKKVGEDIGWWDEDFFWYGEDLDFCYKAREIGNKIIFNPNVMITHHKGISGGIKQHSRSSSSADSATRRRAQGARFDAMLIFYKKHYTDKYPKILTLAITTLLKIIRLVKINI